MSVVATYPGYFQSRKVKTSLFTSRLAGHNVLLRYFPSVIILITKMTVWCWAGRVSPALIKERGSISAQKNKTKQNKPTFWWGDACMGSKNTENSVNQLTHLSHLTDKVTPKWVKGESFCLWGDSLLAQMSQMT